MGQIGGWSDQLDLEWWTNLQAFHWVTSHYNNIYLAL